MSRVCLAQQSSSECAALCENLTRDMKPLRLFHCICLAFSALTLSEPSAAITLGRLRGASVLGQPLDLSIPLQVAGGEDVAGLCVAADVYFGDLPVDSSQVAVHLGSSNGASAVRLSVRRPVDEPVVTIYVKAGCQQQSMRKYVLLSEFTSELQPHPSPALAADSAEIMGRALGSSAGTNVNASSLARPQAPAVSRVEKSKARNGLASHLEVAAQMPKLAEAPSRSSAHAPLKKAPLVGGARLKLLPLDLTQGWEPTLRLTDELSPPSESLDERKRVEAAELWRVINASPEEILHEAGKQATLEAELRSLVEASRANQLAIAELSTELKAVQEKRLFNPSVFALLALLVGCGAFWGAMFLRSRRGLDIPPWWVGAENGRNSEYLVPTEASARNNAASADLSSESSMQAPAESPLHPEIDIPLSDNVFPMDAGAMHESSEPSALTANQNGGTGRAIDFAHSVTGALKAINTQEMVDVRQQADFFLALGQHDDAADVLYGALGQSTESNPYVYLDLIALLHKLSRKEEYEKIRCAFNVLYTGNVPVYGEYSDAGSDLLDYPELCMPLVQLWPTSDALNYIEHCLVREATDVAGSGLDLGAFKDLLLLHGILRSVLEHTTPEVLPNVHFPKRVLPLLSATKPRSSSYEFSVARKHGLDLDLSENH